MADFISDSDDEKAVEELLSQAMDMAILEKVAAINSAGLNDSGLPSHLETRFQNLKFVPSSKQNLNLSHSSHFVTSDSVNETKNFDLRKGKNRKQIEKSRRKLEPCEKGFSPCSKKSPESKNWLSPAKPSDSGSFPPFKKSPAGKLGKKETKSPSREKSGCFLCSLKKLQRKKSKEIRDLDSGLDWGKHDGLLSDLLSVQSQQRMLKKAVKEEEKICREAEIIVKWAKHASAKDGCLRH